MDSGPRWPKRSNCGPVVPRRAPARPVCMNVALRSFVSQDRVEHAEVVVRMTRAAHVFHLDSLDACNGHLLDGLAGGGLREKHLDKLPRSQFEGGHGDQRDRAHDGDGENAGNVVLFLRDRHRGHA
eukprot:6198788-Pleurochrysis_carterae.AAC.2